MQKTNKAGNQATGTDSQTMKKIKKIFAEFSLHYAGTFLKGFDEKHIDALMDSWDKHLKDVNPGIVDKALFLSLERHPSFSPTVGEFKSICKEITPPDPKAYLPEKQTFPAEDDHAKARSAVSVAYMEKCCAGMSIPVKYQSQYKGNFPVREFIDSPGIGIPPSGDLVTHRRCWKEMWKMFEEAWRHPQIWDQIGKEQAA